ncbi:MAG: hypothetical protein COU33_02705 [Candidatus Magasanikbacteria bacterium CG10_big_fil_rev_8_21_14_0_10_43_6]|uniref:Bacteriocin-protection protein n=1 Tax=Candidatus Magasanikbacteria bacterium CG10_big_fil_rev_8_21_14_0_10_43_6 TaxID=1974650 RepID=A0A2M6W177_9BACT|nr:MAG: hypothetical protein COU33_02705 [Candidatus Magasanikbacteria bacterium CG10_big_fil_rev_8_21_14_0_10_43_6]
MTKQNVATSILHTIPADIKKVLLSDASLLETWNSLTPIARNEWICWVTIVKKEETRKDHLKRLRSDLQSGKRRPCCWPGCPHRRPRAQKWFTKK